MTHQSADVHAPAAGEYAELSERLCDLANEDFPPVKGPLLGHILLCHEFMRTAAAAIASLEGRVRELMGDPEPAIDDLLERHQGAMYKHEYAAAANEIRTLVNLARADAVRQAAKVAERSAEAWSEAKSHLRTDADALDAHDRFFNYIENARSLAAAILALLRDEKEKAG